MPVTSVTTDPSALTTTIVAEYPHPRHRVWDAYADPRQIERFWGPPEWPATFSRHDMTAGGWSHYWMSGPDGEISAGYWQFLSVDPPRGFEVVDGFAHPDGTPNPDMPSMRMVFEFDETPTGTRVTDTTYFESVESLNSLIAMGMEEGTRTAMSQIDGVLDDAATAAAEPATTGFRLLSDTQVRFNRVLRGDVDRVWRAHQDPDLLRRWMLGPDGWTLRVCEVAERVGDTFRYEWEQADGTARFGFTGTATETHPPTRAVTTETMIGTEGPTTLNELTFTPLSDGTLLSLVITYPDAEVRDTVLATGMVDGMETSYARLEELLAPEPVMGS